MATKKKSKKEKADVVEEAPATPTESKKSPHKNKRWPVFLGGGIVVALLVSIIGYFGFEYTYQNKVYPGVELNGTNLSGFTYSEVVDEIDVYKTQLEESGMVFTYNDKTFTLNTVIPAEDAAEVSVPLVQIDTDKTAQAIFGVGREKSSTANVTTKLTYLLSPQNIDVVYDIDTETISSLLDNEFSEYQVAYTNADVEFSEDGAISFSSHTDGQQFDWDAVLTEVERNVAELQPVNLSLELVPEPAPIPTSAAEAYKTEIESIVNLAPVTLTYEDKSYEVNSTDLQSWLTITEAGIDFDQEVVDLYLDGVAGEIDVPVKEGRFSLDIVDDVVKLTQFQNGENGLGVNTEKTTQQLRESILENQETTIELVVEVTEPRATPDSLDDLGIKELLGTGETSFAGSPANRRFNIGKGADLLNGLLIAPGEEFSLLSVLSPIDLAHGWLSELVIKNDKLEKEAGGGLCQIGSTVFRATMNSGLQITERRNHSWAVSYYNYNGKAGVDATIYEPSPDYKFINDTDHWVLIRSRIEGSNLYFEFWGTSDGRKGYFTEPTNYGVVSPGPTEEVVDETKPVGYRDCPQHAYTGVSAAFDYIIERADGTKDTETFTSTYKARAASCIVGPAASEEPAPEETTDTTETEVETPTEEATTNENVNTNANTNTDTNTNKNTNKKKDKKG